MINYKYQKLKELQELCKSRGLDDNGKKDTLIKRLLTYDDDTNYATIDMFNRNDTSFPKHSTSNSAQSLDKENFFLHINSSNLSNYFNCGYFYPLALEESEIYKNENRAKDVLSIFHDYIIVGKSLFNQFENTEVLIELVLNDISINEFEKTGLYYVAEPIPVSRVKTIFFKTAVHKDSFLSSIKTFPDSFIPSSICKTIPLSTAQSTNIDFNKIKLQKNENLSKWKDRLKRFDKILGLYAFIKNSGIFYAERENHFEDYTSNFLGSVNLINPIKELSAIKENSFLKTLLYYRHLEITNAQRAIFITTIEKIYADKTLDISSAIDILDSPIVRENAKNNEIPELWEQLELFEQLDNLNTSYKRILQNDVLKKNLPTLALVFLSKFSNKARQNADKQAVRNSFISNEFGFSQNVSEYILGFLGLYYGYKNMIKEDTNLKFEDKNFEKLSTNTQSIKFRLESYLDRFIIESAYQFAIHQNTLSNSFEFLNWNNPESTNKTYLSSSYQYEYIDKSYLLLGQKVTSVLRKDKTDKIFEKIVNQYPNNLDASSYLIAFVQKYLELDKLHILELLKKNKGRYSIEELEKIIDLDNQSRKKWK